MNRNLLILAVAAAAGLWASCDSEESRLPDGHGASAPAPPSAEVRAALEAQPVGRKLLGNTMQLVGDTFVPADLRSAPEYYLIHYSASY